METPLCSCSHFLETDAAVKAMLCFLLLTTLLKIRAGLIRGHVMDFLTLAIISRMLFAGCEAAAALTLRRSCLDVSSFGDMS